MRQTHTGPQGGFTLIEILVALILIALLLGAVVPAVMNQVVKGDTNRVLEDLDAVTTGAQTFRMDVRRWPGDLEDLIFKPVPNSSSTDLDLDGNEYTPRMANKWAGSYLDGVTLVNSSTLATGADGTILGDFADDLTLNGEKYVTFTVTDLPESQVDAIDVAVDGSKDGAAGRVRTSGTTTILYLATPKR